MLRPAVSFDGRTILFAYTEALGEKSGGRRRSGPRPLTARTVAGQFAPRAAKRTEFLGERHSGVQLTAEERRRIIVWLDANSEFYGAYEATDAQSRGEIVHPSLQ